MEDTKTKFRFLSKRSIYLLVGVLVLLFVFSRIVFSRNSKKGGSVNDSINGSSQVKESKPKAFVEINKPFEFKAIDANKKEVPITFTVVSAERKDDIKVKGENRVPVSGKDYLILRIEMQNTTVQRVAIATSDRIRLDIQGKLYAPDYHNGNVVIDPISTKKDLIAFAVDEKQDAFTFQIGELAGEKQVIEVKF